MNGRIINKIAIETNRDEYSYPQTRFVNNEHGFNLD